MPDASTDLVLPRKRYETLMRQALAIREQADALLAALHAEMTTDATDPRTAKPDGGKPATFGRSSQPERVA